MAMVLKSTKDLSREEWLIARRQGLGGSDIGAICGLNKWKSPIAVYLDKVGELPQEDIQSESAYFGNVLEEVVAQEFMRRTGKKVQRRNAILRHEEYPFMLANLDRVVVGERAILECKTVSEYGKKEWEGEEIPESYVLQVQHYLAVTGYEKGYIACLVGGNKFVWKEIPRDEELIKALIEIEKDFWHKVENKIPPALDGSDSSSDVLKMFYPEAKEGTAITLDDEVVTMIAERDTLKEKIKELDFRKDEIENQIKAMLEDNEVGTVKNYIVSWKNVSTTRIDSKALKKDQPKLYAEYSNTTVARKFDIKTKKEGK